MSSDLPEVDWDIPGWDWEDNDFSWLSSASGIHKDGVSIFFIHGGRIRHQAHVPEGTRMDAGFLKQRHPEWFREPS